MSEPPHDAPGAGPVLAVSSNKGGVGKTTVSTNLAVYFRALREELPVLVMGLDDQGTLDRMFRLQPASPGEGNLKHAFAGRSLEPVIQLGQYGVHFVPSPPDLPGLKARAEDPLTLRRILNRTAWQGVVILDTKSDLEALTRSALYAADRILIPVADWASLEEAAKLFSLLEKAGLGRERARVLLTLVDARTRADEEGHDLRSLLEAELDRRGWPRYRSHLSRSPRVEALNSVGGRPLSILHHAQGTSVHRQLRALAEEVLADLGLDAAPRRPLSVRRGPESPSAAGATEATPTLASLTGAFLRGFRGR